MLPRPLLERLAAGGSHTRAELATTLGLTAEELAEQLDALAASGLEFNETPAQGIALAEAIGWLDADRIESSLSPEARRLLRDLRCLFELESTNRLLRVDTAGAEEAGLRVALAEYQHGGRGRRGRSWRMPPGSGIALSVSWRFAQPPPALSALGLAVGAAVRRAIRDVAGVAVGLKWPNDLIVDGRKLGGILVEVDAGTGAARHVVIGVGINVVVPADYLALVANRGYAACDLRSVAPGRCIDRSSLAAAVVNRLAELVARFAATGFEPYRAEWLAAHVLEGRDIELHGAGGIEHGTVCGIEADGALVVEGASGARRRVVAGEVSVRWSR